MALKMRGTRECLRTPRYFASMPFGHLSVTFCLRRCKAIRSFKWKADEAFCELFVRKCLGAGEASGRSIAFCKGNMLPVSPSLFLTPQITQMSWGSRMAGAFKVEDIDRDSRFMLGAQPEELRRSRQFKYSVVGEFSEPLINFAELSKISTLRARAARIFLLGNR